MLVSTQAYVKNYLFPFWSLGTLVRVGVLVAAVILPFFLAYSTPNFYLNSKLQAMEQSITYNYNYHISIVTSQGSFAYTNLYSSPETNPPIITQVEDKKIMQFGVKWPKQPDYLVQKVEISLFFDFVLNGVSYFGSASGEARGYNLAEVSMAGQLQSTQGQGTTNMTQSSLQLVSYQMAEFAKAAQSSSAFLKYEYSTVPINMPCDVFEAEMLLNYGGLVAYQATPSITGQLVWSWTQYFPLFLVIFYLLDKVFAFLVREKVIKRKVVHDGEYISLVEKQKQSRSGLRLR